MKKKTKILFSVLCLLFTCNFYIATAQTTEQSFKEFNGIVIDENTNDPLIFADLVINSSNISTITNTDGEFLLKIPQEFLSETLIISHLGYEKKEIKIANLKNYQKITLKAAITNLQAINVSAVKDARALVLKTLKRRGTVYNNDNTLMTGFYRETIKKRRRNASLSEAIVKIHKHPYSSFRMDAIELIKARKNTDYSKLDTIALKLQGGPFSNLYTDLIKYPEYIFTEEDLPLYEFKYDSSTEINDDLVYIISFKQRPNVAVPMYYGKLYIDSKTLALTSAVYSLNVENRDMASQMYVRKKPRKVDVYPTEANYRVNYRIKDGKWHFAYSNILLTFKVDWEGKLFNSVYTLNSEMAITDWKINDTNIAKVRDNLIHSSTILTDKVSGFSDPEFWGEYNIIEPEKSIESAIKKIQRQLK